jgi:CubicO group peptidase (beta-lactamase class C family)
MATTLRYGTPEEAGMDPRRIEHVKDLARGWVEQGVTPSLVVLAARRGVIVLHEAYGVMGPEPDAGPLQKDTIFPLMSLTKPITATTVMCLVEDGLVGLNRPVQWYLPEFVGEGKEAVMVHHLLTHTSGLSSEELDAHAERKRGTFDILPAAPTQHPWMHEELSLRYDAPLSQPAGKEMSYCNWHYEFLGEIARRVSRMSLADLASERIFQPLGMKDTCWIVSSSARAHVVQRVGSAPHAPLMERSRIGHAPWASGGVHSIAAEMAVFGQMFLNGGSYGNAKVLSKPSVAAMTRNQIPGLSSHYVREYFPEAFWGLGWNITGTKKCLGYAEPLMSPRAFSHSGGGGVFLWIDPEYDLVGVYLSVLSDRGIPEGIPVPQGSPYHRARFDLFVNAVTGAIVD